MQIQEFLPNPAGKDTAGEYIVLFNNSNQVVPLAGWSIKTTSSKRFYLSGTIGRQASVKLPRSVTGINLKNTGDTVLLYTPSGVVADSLSFNSTAAEGIPIFHSGALTPEIRNALFDDLPGKYTASVQGVPTENAWLIMIALGVVFATLAVYIHSHVSEDAYQI